MHIAHFVFAKFILEKNFVCKCLFESHFNFQSCFFVVQTFFCFFKVKVLLTVTTGWWMQSVLPWGRVELQFYALGSFLMVQILNLTLWGRSLVLKHDKSQVLCVVHVLWSFKPNSEKITPRNPCKIGKMSCQFLCINFIW